MPTTLVSGPTSLAYNPAGSPKRLIDGKRIAVLNPWRPVCF
jgi:hypothetical protein